MEKRIKDKIEQIDKYLYDLERYKPGDIETYLANKDKKAICERYLERITEAIVDLVYLVIKNKGFDLPENDLQAFDILKDKEIITEELGERLKDARRMRNILIHQYGEINDEIVFNTANEEIERDANEFIDCVEKCLGD